MFKGRFALAAAIAVAVSLAVVPAGAQDQYPSRPITFVVGNAAGSGPDAIARYVGSKVSPLLGQPVVVENRPGASSILAAEQVARARPDGYTMLVGSNSLAANVYQFKRAPDPIAAFEPVSPLVSLPFILVVDGKSQIGSAKELLDLMKAKGDKASYGAVGTGFFLGEYLKAKTGLKAATVRYRSAPDGMVALNQGQLDYMVTDSIFVLPQARAGNLKMLALTSAQRADFDLAVPTLQESGVPDYALEAWLSAFFPKQTPAPIVNRMHEAITKVLTDAETRRFLANSAGAQAVTGTPAALLETVKAEIPKWAEVLKVAGVVPE